MKTTLVTMLSIFLFLGAGCVTSPSSEKKNDSFEKVALLEIGSDKKKAELSFGKPTKVVRVEEHEEWIFSVPYRKQLIPEVRLVFDKNGLLTEKNINFFNKSLTVNEIKHRFDVDDFVVSYPEHWGKTHFYSPNRYLVSEKSSVSIMYNESRNDEVYSVKWSIPKNHNRSAASQ